MARFARDAELRHRRVDCLIRNRFGAVGRIESCLAVGRVARDADRVPVTVQCRYALVGGREDQGASRRPLLFIQQVRPRQDVQGSLVPRGVPVDVLVVRPRDHYYLAGDTRPLGGRSLPARVVELRPELVAAPFEPHRPARYRVDHDRVEVGPDRLRRRHLGHRPVERRIPGCVLRRMARPAGLRGNVAVLGYRDWPVLDRRFGNNRIACHADCDAQRSAANEQRHHGRRAGCRRGSPLSRRMAAVPVGRPGHASSSAP